jgi:CBS domain-containing protein
LDFFFKRGLEENSFGKKKILSLSVNLNRTKMRGIQTSLEEIMTKELISLRPSDSLLMALEIFEKNSIHHIVITDGKKGKLLGILSKKDMLNVFLEKSNQSEGTSLSEINKVTVEEAMTVDPVYLDPTDTIGLAADLVLSNKFHSLPIVEGNTLVGIVTSHDLLKFAFERIQPEDHSEYLE